MSGGPGGCADALLSSRACSLDAVLVLRVARGNDMFLAVGGAYRPSWMGLRPRTLAERGPYPMSKLWQAGKDVGTGSEDGAAGDEGAEAGDSEAESSGAAHAGAAAGGSGSGPPPERTPGVPLELARLIEALEEEEALGTPGLFMVDACELAPGTADPEPLAAIREALDRGAAAWPRGVGPRDLAAALLAALAALPEPVLPEGAKALCDVASHTTVRMLGRRACVQGMGRLGGQGAGAAHPTCAFWLARAFPTQGTPFPPIARPARPPRPWASCAAP